MTPRILDSPVRSSKKAGALLAMSTLHSIASLPTSSMPVTIPIWNSLPSGRKKPKVLSALGAGRIKASLKPKPALLKPPAELLPVFKTQRSRPQIATPMVITAPCAKKSCVNSKMTPASLPPPSPATPTAAKSSTRRNSCSSMWTCPKTSCKMVF